MNESTSTFTKTDRRSLLADRQTANQHCPAWRSRTRLTPSKRYWNLRLRGRGHHRRVAYSQMECARVVSLQVTLCQRRFTSMCSSRISNLYAISHRTVIESTRILTYTFFVYFKNIFLFLNLFLILLFL